jgi:tetratricopeptide (TPR) repeat protein
MWTWQNQPEMKNPLCAYRRHRLWRGGLLVVPSLWFFMASEAWAQTARPPSQPLGDQIEDALAKGNPDAARALVPRFLAQRGVPEDKLLRTGVDLAQHELFPEAADVFGRCVKDRPALFEGYYNLALAELALRKYPAALSTLQKAPPASPPEEVARTYLRGKIELALGQNAQGEEDLAAAFAAAPQEENYALDLGLAYLRARKYQPAAEVFEKAGSFQKDSPFILLGLGLAQFLEGRNAASIATCHSVLRMHPEFSPVRVLLAFVLTMQGNVDEAAQVAARGLHDPAPFPYLYYIHAAALLKQQSKDYGVILEDLALAERSMPACSLCYLAQSKAHQKMGERDAATADLEKALEMDSMFAEAWYRLASLYDQAGRHAEAQQARRRFEDLKGNKADRETEMLRDVFLKTLGDEGAP